MLTLVVLLLCSTSCFSASVKGELVRRDFLGGMFGAERGRWGSFCGQEESPRLRDSRGDLLRASGDEANVSQ